MEEMERTEWTAAETEEPQAEAAQTEERAQDDPAEEECARERGEEIPFPPQLPEDELPWQAGEPRQEKPERQEQDIRQEAEWEKPGGQLPAGGKSPPRGTPDFREQVQRLLARYPGVRALPDEVVYACARDGRDLVEAYEAHRTRQTQQAENRSLRRELAVLRQNEDARRRAPVTGVGPGGGVPSRGEDDFLRGFNSEY